MSNQVGYTEAATAGPCWVPAYVNVQAGDGQVAITVRSRDSAAPQIVRMAPTDAVQFLTEALAVARSAI